jgi:ammonia channel protein AmtB
MATDDLGVSTILLLAGKLSTVVSSSSGAATSLLETVVISSPLAVGMISVCFMKPVKISNRSSSDILGLVAGKGVVGVTPGKGVVNRLKAGRLLLFLVV